MHLAAAAGSPAPAITALTHLAGVINGIDYPRDGLTLERMGLAGKTPAEIRAHVDAPAAEPADPAATKPRGQVRTHPHRACSARSAPSAAS